MSDERNEAEPIELGYIEDLGDMISVQEGSTVSRTVMQKAGGNVVLFSFDTGEELGEHTAAMPVFVQTLKGRLKVTGNGRTVELVPGAWPTSHPHPARDIRRGAVRHDADDGHAGTRQHRRLKNKTAGIGFHWIRRCRRLPEIQEKLPPGSFRFAERTTGLGPAVSTLARLRFTN